MSDRWNEEMSLTQIRKIVIEIVNEDIESGQSLGKVARLSETEQRILGNNLSNFINLSNLEHYCICVLLVWLNSFYFKKDEFYLHKISEVFQGIPQHYTHCVYQYFWDTFHAFGLSTKGHDCRSVIDIHELLRSYAEETKTTVGQFD